MCSVMDVTSLYFCSIGFILSTVSGLQHFSVSPQDTSIIQGDTAILNCSVENRVGAVQWVKDGILLGGRQDLPGWSRYSILGNMQRDFNLQVRNVILDDDARFQCQVAPVFPDEPALQAFAHLTVLVPPNMPEILGHDNGTVMQVSYTISTFQLTCLARNGRPAATIRWYRNTQELVSNIVNTIETIENDKRENARSVLTYPLNYREDNGAVFTCEAVNNAVIGSPLKVVVQLSVQYPPDPPEITGVKVNQTLHVNDTVILVCTARGGNPLADVVWFKNDQRMDMNYTQRSNEAINSLTRLIQPSDNNAEYRCEASNVATPVPLTASRTLVVHFGPESVSIEGETLAKAGDTVTLTCTSSNSNPASVITWVASQGAPGAQITETNSRQELSTVAGFITISEIQVTLSHQYTTVMYTCQANNVDLGKMAVNHTTLSVLYPPSAPEIYGYNEGDPIRAGQLQRMTCRAVGGNPRAELKWYKGDELLISDNSEVGNIASAEIAIVTRPDDNGAIYKCTASNEATDVPLETVKKLTVHFAPSKVTVTAVPPKPRVGQKVTLTCVSASSNPAAVITWIYKRETITGTDQGMTDAEFGGKSSKNTLDLYPDHTYHGEVYSCRAKNMLLDETVTEGITLNVPFKPVFDEAILQKLVKITEHESQVINFTVAANPPAVNYSLWRNGFQMMPGSVSSMTLDVGVLTITSIQRDDGGDYSMMAVNTEGSTTFNYTIDVQFPAEITSANSVEADQGGTAELECMTTANPVIDNMVTWRREGFDMSRTLASFENGIGKLQIEDLMKTDSGMFTCIADNGVGVAATQDVELTVMFTPEIDKSPEYTKAASEKGLTGRLVCKAEGAPRVSFMWRKDGAVIDLSRSDKYEVQEKVSDTMVYENILLVKNVVKEDYGVYECVVTNPKGEDTFPVVFDGTSKPDPPYDIEFVNATFDSITLTWKAGFSGGKTQYFTVRYKPTSDSLGFTHVDVVPPNATIFTVTGLALGTEYDLTVKAYNILGASQYQSKGIVATTSNKKPISGKETDIGDSSEDTPVIIILVVCVVGIFLLALNIGLILFFVRRRKKRMENGSDTTSHTNTIELYGPNKESALYPVSPSDENRSYGTYDKSMDDFSDDYKAYEDEDLKRVFLPPPEYSSVTYSHNKLDSPSFEHRRPIHTEPKQTYLDDYDEDDDDSDDRDIRKSPYRYDDPYRPGRRNKGTFESTSYANHVRENSASGSTYEANGRIPGRHETRPKSITDMSERSSRPPSRTSHKTPPPPPMRSSSKGAADIPPLPARNYGPQDVEPRYVPPPGSLSSFNNNVNVVPNPTYAGPSGVRTRSPLPTDSTDDMRGHLV